MIDVISGEEPPIETGDEPLRNFGVPHPGWFLTAVVLQLAVLFFIGASKLYAMPPTKIVKVQALNGYVSHDKFRGNYITDVIFNADAASVLSGIKAKEVVLIFDSGETVSALDSSAEKWKFVRIGSTGTPLGAHEIALRAKVSPSRFQSGKQMIFINTTPFFVAEDEASSLGLRESSRSPAEFKLAVDQAGNASIVAVDTENWLSASRSP